jgi:hypothetical protein
MVFSGAGVLIFNGDNIILFRERKSRAYTEPGGKFDKKHKDLEEVAIDELYEETCCLFDMTNIQYKNNYIDIEYDNGRLYRIYIINIVGETEDLESKYKENLYRLNYLKAKKYYLETDKIVFVSIEEILKGKKYIRDIHDQKIKLRERLLLCIKALFNEIKTIVPLNVGIKKVIKNDGLETYVLQKYDSIKR